MAEMISSLGSRRRPGRGAGDFVGLRHGRSEVLPREPLPVAARPAPAAADRGAGGPSRARYRGARRGRAPGLLGQRRAGAHRPDRPSELQRGRARARGRGRGTGDIFVRKVGDARNLSEYADGSVDLVHSNSVIEHVGGWADMRAMADEMMRIGRSGWMQTPAWEFPVEPHFRAPSCTGSASRCGRGCCRSRWRSGTGRWTSQAAAAGGDDPPAVEIRRAHAVSGPDHRGRTGRPAAQELCGALDARGPAAPLSWPRGHRRSY